MEIPHLEGTVYLDEDPHNADWIKNVGLGGSERNADLARLYRYSWFALSRMRAQDPALSAPYFAWVHPDYDRADVRLVVVGQETNGWGDCLDIPEDPAEATRILMHEYRDFNLGADYAGRAAYWNPIRDLYRRLNPKGPESGFVALNVSIVDQGKREPDTNTRDQIIRLGLLPDQIKALDPHVVVFHTGPTHEDWIDLAFPGVSRSGDRILATLAAPSLPEFSFRTYHPRYLSYRRELASVYDRIRDAVLG